jgi:hypothetical protein
MATRKLIIPKFASEAEDAQWHDRHRRELERAVERHIREGSALTLRQVAARSATAACDHPAADRRH